MRSRDVFDIKFDYKQIPAPYESYLIDDKYYSLRDLGNILAGYTAAIYGVPEEYFQKAAGAYHVLGDATQAVIDTLLGITHGPPPNYGEIDQQRTRSEYGYQLGLKDVRRALDERFLGLYGIVE